MKTTRQDSLKVSEYGIEKSEELKGLAEGLARHIELFPGRASSIALTHLQTAVMFDVRAIAENCPEGK